MKKWYLTLLLPVFYFLGCGGVTTNVSTSKQNVNEVVKYKGPKARIAVASFKCKAAKCNGQIGSGISDMLTTALFKTGKFIVVERSGEGLGAIEKELSLNTSMNRPSRNLEGADILVVGAITAFEPKAGGITAGGIVVPRGVPFLGGMKFGKNEAYIAADIRLIDVRTGRIINATTVEGRASKWSVGGLGGGVTSSIALGGGLSVYKNTPMEKAIRVMIDNAVKEISKLVPENYYRYDAAGNPVKPATQNNQNQTLNAPQKQSQQKKENYKLIFSEDFEKYGNGQSVPFGPWKGQGGHITVGVQANGKVGKVLNINADDVMVCLESVKVKDFILDLDVLKYNPVIYFRLSDNPKVGYKIHFSWNDIVLDKIAGNIVTQVAKNKLTGVDTNKWYHMKIIAKDNHIQVFINGRNHIDVVDDDKFMNKKGKICFGEDGSYPYYVDNIQIRVIK